MNSSRVETEIECDTEEWERLAREDAESRRVAQTCFDRPLVLEAGAGTGKTTVLVARVLVWCLGPGWERSELRLLETRETASPATEGPAEDEVASETLRRVVAITFTEAAAAEMATRVGEALLELWHGRLPLGVLEDLLPPSDSRRTRARALLDALDQLTVRTIHAWCRRLLVSHPLEAGVHPRFEIDADERLQAEVVREVMEARLRDAYVDDAHPHFLELADAGRGFGPPEIEEALAELVKAAVMPGVLDEDPVAPERVEAFRRSLASVLEGFREAGGARLAAVKGKRTRQTAEAVEECRGLVAEPWQQGPEGLATFLERAKAIWDVGSVKRLGEWARGRFSGQESAALGADAERMVPAAAALVRAVRHLGEIDLELLGAARAVLRPLLAEASRLLRQRGIETYAALLRDASGLLHGSPAEAARIRSGIDQLLVDEFQDTDALQCRILRALAFEGDAEERPVLFLVGDPKQSIYGWRNADLGAYDGFLADVEQRGGERCRLTVNFRSAPPILDETARAVAPLMEAREGVQPPFQKLAASPSLRDSPGFHAASFAPVEHWVVWGWDAVEGRPRTDLRSADVAELEARTLARDLVAIHQQGVGWGEVAVLFRGLADAEVYLEALRKVGVPYVVERDRHYYQRREIVDASALVRALLDPHDQLALVTTLRSPWVGVPDAALLPLWSQGLPALIAGLSGDDPTDFEPVARAVEAAGAAMPGGVPGLDRIAGWEASLLAFLRSLAHLRRCFEEDASDVFVEKLRALLAVEGTEAFRYLGAYRVGNLDRFFRDLVFALEQTGGDAFAVLGSLRAAVAERREQQEGRPRDAAENAVHVMTIHGAKGLDWKHVYLVQLHKRQPHDRAARTEVASGASGAPRREGEDGAGGRSAQVPYRLLGAPTLDFDAVARDSAVVEQAERIRLLYVALTRAKERLVVAGRRPATAASRETIQSMAELLSLRADTPDLTALMVELRGGDGSFADRNGARFRFPALEADEIGSLEAAEESGALPGLEELRQESDRLARCRQAAELRSARSLGGTAAKDAEEPGDPALFLGPRSVGSEPVARPVALLVGTAVHRALEKLPLGLDAEAVRAAAIASIERSLPNGLSPVGVAERESARSRACDLLDRFFGGPLFQRLEALQDHIVARELPVLLPPPRIDEGPVGFVNGAIDLLYRDPETGALVVADYKTDALEDETALHTRAASYAEQGAIYTRALHEALTLDHPPRFELWFLHEGRILPT